MWQLDFTHHPFESSSPKCLEGQLTNLQKQASCCYLRRPSGGYCHLQEMLLPQAMIHTISAKSRIGGELFFFFWERICSRIFFFLENLWTPVPCMAFGTCLCRVLLINRWSVCWRFSDSLKTRILPLSGGLFALSSICQLIWKLAQQLEWSNFDFFHLRTVN